MSERVDSACIYNLGGPRGGGRKREEGMFVKQLWTLESRKIVPESTASKTHFGITSVCSVHLYVLPHLIHTTYDTGIDVAVLWARRPKLRKMCNFPNSYS